MQPCDLAVAVQMWPSPTTQDHFSARVTANRRKVWQSHPGITLLDAVRLWPTPTAMNHTGGPAMNKWGGSGSRAKLRTMVTPAELNGALNPTWVEWLMGYPLEWTDCGASETRSSRKSPNGLPAVSASPSD